MTDVTPEAEAAHPCEECRRLDAEANAAIANGLVIEARHVERRRREHVRARHEVVREAEAAHRPQLRADASFPSGEAEAAHREPLALNRMERGRDLTDAEISDYLANRQTAIRHGTADIGTEIAEKLRDRLAAHPGSWSGWTPPWIEREAAHRDSPPSGTAIRCGDCGADLTNWPLSAGAHLCAAARIASRDGEVAAIEAALRSPARDGSEGPDWGCAGSLDNLAATLYDAGLRLAAPSAPSSGDLDAAWREAEAALPEKYQVRLTSRVATSERMNVQACAEVGVPMESGFAAWMAEWHRDPAAALHALAARLASQPRTSSSEPDRAPKDEAR